MTAPPLHQQLADLRAPQDLGKYGIVTLSAPLLTWVNLVVSRWTTTYELPVPTLYATPDGQISAEWTIGEWEVIAKIGAPDRGVRLVAVCTNDDRRGDYKETTVNDVGAYVAALYAKGGR